MLVRHRNVLNRVERLEKLKDEEKWHDDKSVYGLPKVGHRKAAVVKVAKEAAAEGEAAKGAPAAAGAKPAAAAGKAAPAAGAKAAAPAAKAPAKK